MDSNFTIDNDSSLLDDYFSDNEINDTDDVESPNLDQSSDFDEELDSSDGSVSDSKEVPSNPRSKISTKIVASSFTKRYLNGTNLVAYLQTTSGNPISGKTVVLNFSGTIYTRTTDSDGKFTLTIRAHPRTYTTKISFAGDSTYAASNKTITITVEKAFTNIITPSSIIKYYQNDTNLITYLKDDYGNYLVNKTMKITLDGQDHYINTDSDGKVMLNLDMAKGYYEASIFFDGDNDYLGCYCPTNIQIIMHNTFFVNVSKNLYSQGKFHYRLLSDGLAFPNQTVTLNVNGINYTSITDDEGAGSINLNLSQGLWKATLTYNGHDDYDSCSGTGWINVTHDSMNFTLEEIINSSISLYDYINNNLLLPGQWEISGNNISIFESSYLMAKAICNIEDEMNSSIVLPYIYRGCDYEDSISSGALTHFSYMNLIENIVLFAEMNSYMPSNASLSGSDIDFKTYTYSFTKILAFYNITGFLPKKNDFDTDVNSSLTWIYTTSTVFLNEEDFRPGLNEYYNGSDNSSYLFNEDSSPDIINCANNLTSNLDSINDKVEALFYYVRDCITYTFYTGSRGADYALVNGYGNFYDQDRLLAALCRAINVPVRINQANNIVFISELVLAHGWVQILVGDIWYVADPVSTRNYLGIINSWSAVNMTDLKQGNSFSNLTDVDIEGISYNGFPNASVTYAFADDYQFNDTVTDYGIGSCNFMQTDIYPMKSLTYMISNDAVFDYGSASGKVLLIDEYGTPLANKNILLTIGEYSCNLTTDLWGYAYYNLNMNPGNYTLFYSFDEDDNYLHSVGNSSISIMKASSNISIINTNLSQDDYLSFIVLDSNNNPIFNQSVTINVGNRTYDLITDLQGLAIVNDAFDHGSYSGNCFLNDSIMYDSCECNFTFNVSPTFKFESEDEYLLHSGSEDINVSLVYKDIHLGGVDVSCKIINSHMEIVKEYVLNSGDGGIITIPTSDLEPGKYVISYYCNPLTDIKPFAGQCDLYIAPDNLKIKSRFDIVENQIHQKGEYFVGRLLDDFGHPIANANVSIYINAINKTYYRVTDDDGRFRLAINLKSNNYSVFVSYLGDDDYKASNRISTIFASHIPNIAYTINMTLKNDITINNNHYKIPFGREIGIYKNGNLYKFTYDYNLSGATKLNHSVYYFLSMDDNRSAVNVSIDDPIRHSGFLLYSDGYNVLIRFLGYAYGDLDSFNVIFDGKRYGSKNISNVTILRNNQAIASFYFTSEIITSVTNAFASSHNVNARNFIYYPVRTEFRLVESEKSLFGPSYDISSGTVEYLYYGDNTFNNDLNNSHWSSSIGFEAIETYLLNKGGKISDDLMSDYLEDYANFSSNNARKVAYESFLTALSYQWLDDKLADEVSESYDSTWFKYSYYLIGSFVNLNGRGIDVQTNIWFSSIDSYSHQLALNEYCLKSSLLEQYVVGLNGLNSTCAFCEILRGLLNGSEFSCYQDNLGGTFFGFGDNSSYLQFDALGNVASLISPSMYDGGISLGSFNFNSQSSLINNLNNILQLVNDLSILNPVLSCIIDPMIGGIVSSVENMNFTKVMTYLTDTKLLAGIAGGIITEIGLVSTLTGVGASW
ncbi:transglutaminase domain-containing protein, partial [Methanobrevibacter sp.]|uniref:transglutaminase domain-containing protein n=1 Tax=Methanobrevibacter sp. TaxID=66852 RepID=UPI00388E7B9D